ncbi:MAG: carboxypeptidase regulatory-like domain-containing protein [Anaerolineae bacterium]|nr:carboxypeptidase regulatory-like domain-containing protein [Anaerolineae bacterium]
MTKKRVAPLSLGYLGPAITLLLVVLAVVVVFWAATRSLTIGGVVREEGTAQPVPGVTVYVGSYVAETDTEGRWRAVVPRRPQIVSYQAAGFLPVEAQIVPTLFPLVMTGLETMLAPAGIWGLVQNEATGEPVAGAQVYFGDYQAQTDESGHFALSHLPDGEGMLTVVAPGYRSIQTPVSSPRPPGSEPIVLTLAPTSVVGTVSDARTGAPLAGAQVRVADAEAIAGADGRYQLFYLSGDAEVQVSASGYEPAVASLQAVRHLEAGEALNVALAPTELAGRITDARSGAAIAARLTAGEVTVQADKDGRYTFYSLPKGVMLRIEADGYDPAERRYDEQETLDVKLTPRFSVVQVTDGFLGSPLAGVVVKGPKGEAKTDAEGKALLPLLSPGQEVSAAHEGYDSITVPYEGQSVLAIALQSARQTVIVRDEKTGKPVPVATIYVGDKILYAKEDGTVSMVLSTSAPITVKAAGYYKATNGPTLTLAKPLKWQSAECPAEAAPPCAEVLLTPFKARGIYLGFGFLSSTKKMTEYLDFVAQSPVLNSITVDVKSDRGRLGWDSQVAVAKQIGAPQKMEVSLRDLTKWAHEREIYVVARMVIFKDHPLANKIPEWGVHRANGTIWIDGEELAWANPYLSAVWQYNIDLAREVAAMGFDEIQMDYVRFPSDGDIGAIVYPGIDNNEENRTASIREFTRRFYAALQPYQVFVSADVFGLTVWVTPESGMGIGQRVIDIAPNVDYLCPMVYPQTFGPGNAGYRDPWNYPYEIVYNSTIRAQDRIPSHTRVRPWIQAYGCCGRGGHSLAEKMIQRLAAENADSSGWTYWHAGGVYDSELFGPLPSLEVLQAQVDAVTGRKR